MIPVPFDYVRPTSVDEALGLLDQYRDEAKVLAGGHSLIPAMKLRLAQPKLLIDIAHISALSNIEPRNGGVKIGALATHAEVESSDLIRDRCPVLSEVAPQVGDLQVRNKGTIGGSLVHADPAADWQAAILALDAELEIISLHGRRTIRASEFFVDMLQTAVQPHELLSAILVPVTGRSVAYLKCMQKASGFALTGVAAILDAAARTVRVGITGVAPMPYRARAVEDALHGTPLTAGGVAAASRRATEGITPLSDIHASAEFRTHLAQVYTNRALTRALSRAA
jgi:carbon-monoxide dehydrogenase medium subunit